MVLTGSEVEELLKKEKPEVVIISETKWKDEWGIPDIGLDTYNIWMKNRCGKGGGGVMIWTRKTLEVIKVEIKENTSEIVNVVIKSSSGGEMAYVGVYVPPLTTAWTRREHEELIKDTIEELDEITSKQKDILIVGDFNCKEINWGEKSCIGGEETWGVKLLNWAEENILKQWIECDTRFRGRDTPSRLDLLFTSDDEAIERISYECPLGKSDHTLIGVTLRKNMAEVDIDYKLERHRYNKADFEGLRKFFGEVDWSRFDEEEDVINKWEEFVNIYQAAVSKFVPKRSVKSIKGKEWFNRKCLIARNEKRKKWNRWIKDRSDSR